MSEHDSGHTFVTRLGLTVARLSTAAWVGAASLFVVTALREVRYPGFDSMTKDALALLRFPAYYACGFTLVIVALLGALSASFVRYRGCGRARLASGLLAVVLLLMAADFVSVYRPMVDMITPPGGAQPAQFQSYHRVSIWLNSVNIGLCAAAAVVLCWPGTQRDIAGGTHVE